MFLDQSGLPSLPQCHRLMANVAFGIAARGHKGRDPKTIWAPNRRAGLKGAAMSFAAAPVPISSTIAVPSTSVTFCPGDSPPIRPRAHRPANQGLRLQILMMALH